MASAFLSNQLVQGNGCTHQNAGDQHQPEADFQRAIGSDIVSIQELCNWKKRRLSLDYIKLLKIARRLAVSYEWLLNGNTLSMEQNCCNHFDDLQTRDRRLAVEIINSLYFAEQYRFMQIDNNRRK